MMEASPAFSSEVMFGAAREALRNAARHGRGGSLARPLHLRVAMAWRDGLELAIEDDGVGLNGASPSGAGSGQGLALHSTMLAIIGCTLTAETAPAGGTRVVLALPVSAHVGRTTNGASAL